MPTFVKRVLIKPLVAVMVDAITEDTLRVLVVVIMSIMVLLMMFVAISELTVIDDPMRVLKEPALMPTFVPFNVETVRVELMVPELTVKAFPKAVWYDRFTVDTFSELRLIALTDEVISVE